MNTSGVSLDIAGSIQLIIYLGGTFNFGDIDGQRGVLTREEVNTVLSYADN